MSGKNITIDFVKMSGAGNDFVLVDNRSASLQLNWAKLAPLLCNRHYGIGADGLLIIDKHHTAHFVMSYYNADGSSGGMCGNGGRCVAAFVMNENNLAGVNFYALDSLYTAEKTSQDNVKLKMKAPFGIETNIGIKFKDEFISVHFINTGSPHAIVFIEEMPLHLQNSVREKGIVEIAKCVRTSDHFAPAGANVDFISIDDRHSISMRTYERGVEGETLACGTGAVASAIIYSFIKNLHPPIVVNTRSNEKLVISFEQDGGQFDNVTLEGPVKTVFKGQYLVENVS